LRCQSCAENPIKLTSIKGKLSSATTAAQKR
jgi:hypothetical protein